MILPPEYNWLESYLNNDSLWISDTLNWEETFDLVLSEFSVYSFLTSSFFVNSYFFSSHPIKLSFLDILMIFETDKINCPRELYDLFLWDFLSFFSNKFLPAQFFFYSDFQDFLIIILYHSPEIIIALNDYLNIYWINSFFKFSVSIGYDLFNDSINIAITEFVEHLILFFAFIWLLIIFTNLFRIFKWTNPLEIYFIKFLNYFYSTSKEARLQFEAMLQTIFFFFFYWSMMIATFDDDKEELIEIFDASFFYFFLLIIFYLFFKYSLHYFSFLEASFNEGKSVSFIVKQFFRDFINTFALFLRFFILLIRLNVYDNLDDFYDSYYIFIGDFDDDEYFNELFFYYHSFFFYDFDNHDDRLFGLEEENEFIIDFFYLYFLCWSKFFMFIFFILEEILRLSLAFYICYLIIFEVHAVNSSYVENNFNNFKKNTSNLYLFK
jgi:hypothetical protein